VAKGRPADPTRTRRGTGNRPAAGKAKPAPAPVVAIASAASAPALPAAPPDLPAEAVDLWDTVIAELWPRGLRPADLEGVRMLVLAAYRNRQAEAVVSEHGILVMGTRGNPIPNPALKIAKDTRADYLRLADAFGLTLAARLRLGLMQLAGESLLQSLNTDLDRGWG